VDPDADSYVIHFAGLTGRVRSIHEPLGLYRVHGRNKSEASAVSSLDKLRYMFMRDHECARLGMEFAERHGFRCKPDRSRFQPGKCKERLISLRLAPREHPLPQDTVPRLVLAGLRAAFTFPYLRAGKRPAVALGFLALAILPRAALTRRLDMFISDRSRGPLLRRLLSNDGLA